MSDTTPSAADPFGQIADEFVEAFRQGKRPSVEEFARRYPEQADEIRDMLIEECGSVYSKAGWEIEYVVDALRAAAGDARHVMGETMPMTMPGQLSISRSPLCCSMRGRARAGGTTTLPPA